MHKKNCIIDKMDVMKTKMDNTRVIISVHKKQVDSKKTGHSKKCTHTITFSFPIFLVIMGCCKGPLVPVCT